MFLACIKHYVQLSLVLVATFEEFELDVNKTTRARPQSDGLNHVLFNRHDVIQFVNIPFKYMLALCTL